MTMMLNYCSCENIVVDGKCYMQHYWQSNWENMKMFCSYFINSLIILRMFMILFEFLSMICRWFSMIATGMSRARDRNRAKYDAALTVDIFISDARSLLILTEDGSNNGGLSKARLSDSHVLVMQFCRNQSLTDFRISRSQKHRCSRIDS